jgi:hypothetical protein
MKHSNIFPIPNINLGKPFHHSLTNTKFNKKRTKWRDEMEKKEKI